MPHDSSTVRCVIVDDHQMVLDLLVAAVNGISGLSVVATATDIVEADRLAALQRIDLLIVDRRLKTGDGMDLVRVVSRRHPGMTCIVITTMTADFVCPPDLLQVVASVIDKADACGTLLAEIARVMGRPAVVAHSSAAIRSRLTVREWEVFVALGEGLSNKELAKSLGLSTRTVETHRKSIARKLGVSGAALVRLAVLERPTRQALVAMPAGHDGALSAAGRGA